MRKRQSRVIKVEREDDGTRENCDINCREDK